MTTKRVCHRFICFWVADPFVVHDEPVFIRAGREQKFFRPAVFAERNHGRRRAMPIVERARDANALCGGMDELEMHQCRAGGGRRFGFLLFYHRIRLEL